MGNRFWKLNKHDNLWLSDNIWIWLEREDFLWLGDLKKLAFEADIVLVAQLI